MIKTSVYVSNFTGFDYTDAQKHGELIYITKGFVDFTNLLGIKKRVIEFIKDSKEEDFLLISGNNLLCAICINQWLNHHPKCKVLHWNGMKREYDLHILTNEE